jgi:hypothetical protein
MNDLSEWADWNEVKHTIFYRFDATSGRIDWSRSNLIRRALALKVDVLIMLDTDVKMFTSFRDTLSYIQQDIARGFDCITGPTVGVNGRVMMRYMDDMSKDTPPSGKSAFEIQAAAFGFAAFTRKCLEKWQPVSFIIDIQNDKYPLYMDYSNNTTEDFNACYRMREAGLRVACDPRIRAGHVKEIILQPRWFDDPPEQKQDSYYSVPQYNTAPQPERLDDSNRHGPDPHSLK